MYLRVQRLDGVGRLVQLALVLAGHVRGSLFLSALHRGCVARLQPRNQSRYRMGSWIALLGSRF